MSTPKSDDRTDAIDAILGAPGALAAARSAYGERVAQRLGLAPADVDVLRRLAVEGSMTVGRIGEVTGLTTGATTRLVDRLEQAGVVRRVADPPHPRRGAGGGGTGPAPTAPRGVSPPGRAAPPGPRAPGGGRPPAG